MVLRRAVSSVKIIRLNEVYVAHAKCLRQLIKSNHCWVPVAPLQSAKILLTEARASFNLLLSETLLTSDSSKISSNQFSHVHACLVAVYIQ